MFSKSGGLVCVRPRERESETGVDLNDGGEIVSGISEDERTALTCPAAVFTEAERGDIASQIS